MKATSATLAGLDPLKDLLSDVLARLEALESSLGKGSDLGASSRGLDRSSRGLDRSSRHSIAQPPKAGSVGTFNCCFLHISNLCDYDVDVDC
jgi:hypothetical protein